MPVVSIPAFQIEEHHEAFFIWQYAIKRGFLAPSANTLLHIDEHSDLGIPRLRCPVESVGNDLRDIAAFTYSELDIGNFILLAAYQGILKNFYWMRHGHGSEVKTRHLAVRAANSARTEFAIDSRDDAAGALKCALISADSAFSSEPRVILDIDLDYFCSNAHPDYSDCKVEVTESAWRDFVDNPYHFLRLAPGSRVTAAEKDGRYFLQFGSFEKPLVEADDQAAQTWEIAARLERLMGFLDRNQVIPDLIVTCRSRYSGYTPAEHCDAIERALWDRLKQRYDCNPVKIANVLTELGFNANTLRRGQIRSGLELAETR